MHTTHPIRKRRAHHIATQRHVAAGRASHKATEDAEWDDIRLLHDDIHVLVDHRPVLEVEEDGGVAVYGGSLRLWGRGKVTVLGGGGGGDGVRC